MANPYKTNIYSYFITATNLETLKNSAKLTRQNYRKFKYLFD